MFLLRQPSKKPTRQWHSVRLEAPQLVEREHERMTLLFNCVFMAAGRPRGANLWMTSTDSKGGANVYLSPQATPLLNELVRRYEADACDPPSSMATLIAGDGYCAQERRPRTVGSRTTTSDRSFLPARYTYRSVRALTQQHNLDPDLYASHQMAPFVERFARAWVLVP